MSSEQWWEQVEARRAPEPELSGIRAESNDEVDAWQEREADIEPNLQGKSSGKKQGGGPGMMPPMMGGMGGGQGGGGAGAGVGAVPPVVPVGAPVAADGGVMLQTAGMSSAARSAGVGSAGAGGFAGPGPGGVGAAGASSGEPSDGGTVDLNGNGIPDQLEQPEGEDPLTQPSVESPGKGEGPVGGPGGAGDGSQVNDSSGSFTVDPESLRVIASRWEDMSNRAIQLSDDSAKSRSDFALLRDADSSHHELTGKATNWSAGAGTEFKELNQKLTSAADEYKAAEDSGVAEAGKVN